MKELIRNVPVALNTFSAEQALQEVRNKSYEQSNFVFVCNEKKQLKGVVPLEVLLRSDKQKEIAKLMRPAFVCPITSKLEKACNLAGKNNQSFIAVNNSKNEFIGIIPPEIIISTLMNAHTEDLHTLAGIRKRREEAARLRKENYIHYAFHRLPWLLAGLLFSFVATYIVSRFEKTLANHITLTFFIPAIVYLADAVGTQTETVLIRNLSLADPASRKNLKREIFSGVLIAGVLATVCFLLCGILNFSPKDSMIVSLSVGTAGIIAVIIGMTLPLLLFKTGSDPAYGSGPMATIIQDVISIYIYLLIANSIYS